MCMMPTQVVELAFVQRQARVRCLPQLVEDVFPVVVDIDGGDFLARDHDVVHRDVLEIEDRQQHLPVTRRNHRAGLGHHRAQFFGRHGLAALVHAGFTPNDRRNPYAALLVNQADRRHHEHQHLVDVGGRQRHRIGLERGVDLRRELAEHDHDDRQRRHGDRDGVLVAGALR